MKIINSNIFQVIYYYYYLFQKWINGGVADFMALNMISCFSVPIIAGILVIISALIYKYWIGLFLTIFVFFYTNHVLFKTIYDSGLTKKIIKKKPKILNSNILSIIFVILFTVFSFLFFFGCGYLAREIDARDIHLIK